MTITLENRGATTWTSSVRLAAATGCPDARAVNDIAWEPNAGSYRFAARMVDEGGVWFGTTAIANVIVTTEDQDDDDIDHATAPAGCGDCDSGGGAGLALGLLIGSVRRRRRRSVRPSDTRVAF